MNQMVNRITPRELKYPTKDIFMYNGIYHEHFQFIQNKKGISTLTQAIGNMEINAKVIESKKNPIR